MVTMSSCWPLQLQSIIIDHSRFYLCLSVNSDSNSEKSSPKYLLSIYLISQCHYSQIVILKTLTQALSKMAPCSLKITRLATVLHMWTNMSITIIRLFCHSLHSSLASSNLLNDFIVICIYYGLLFMHAGFMGFDKCMMLDLLPIPWIFKNH